MTEKKKNPDFHQELEKFNIYIDEFGQVRSTLSQEALNRFLNSEVEDKKFSQKVLRQLERMRQQVDTEEEE